MQMASRKKTKPITWVPKPAMLRLIHELTDIENINNISKACEQAGVSRFTYYAWLEDPHFLKLYEDARTRSLRSAGAILDKTLVALGMAGDVQAIRTYYEKQGEIKDKERTGNIQIFMNEIPRPAKGADE